MVKKTNRKARRGPLYLLAFLSFTIFSAEALIMLGLNHAETFGGLAAIFGMDHSEVQNSVLEGITDAFLLTAIVFPVFYFLVVRKLNQRNRELADSESRLEDRVEERTTKLQELNINFNTALANMSQGLCMFDGEHRLIVANKRYAEIYGFSAEVLKQGIALRDILEHRISEGIYSGADTEAYIQERLAWVIRRDRCSKIQRLSDGRYIEIIHQPMPGGGWVDTHEDITVRRRAENAYSQIVTALEQSNDMIVLFDPEDRIVFANQAWQQLNSVVEWSTKPGITFEQHLRALTDGGFVPEAIGHEEKWITERLDRHHNPQGSFELSRQDNKWISINEQVLNDGSIILVISDITEQKRVEEKLEEQASSLALLNSIAVAANRSSNAEEVFGYCIEQVCKFSGWKVGHAYVPADDGSGRMEPARYWFAADSDLYAPFREMTERTLPVSGTGLVGHVLKRGEPYWTADVTADPNFARAGAAKASGLKGGVAFPVKIRGEVTAVLEFFATEPMEPSPQLIDILTHVAGQLGQVVERQRSEIKLTDQNERFDAALANMSQGLCMFDGEQRLIVCNKRYASLYGLSPEQVKPGTTLEEIVEDRIANGLYACTSRETYRSERQNWANCGENKSKIQEFSDGRSIAVSRQPMAGGGWVTTHEDVTEITRAQQVVQRQKEELDQILLNVPRAVVTADKNGIIRIFNPAAEQTFGYAEAEAVGCNVSMLMPEGQQKHHDGYMRSYAETGMSKFISSGPRRLIGRHKDGSEFPMELALGVVGQGKDTGFIGVAKDITEELKAENQLIEHRDLLQKEVDLATVELRSKAEELTQALVKEKELNELQRQFVTMASHEFRTPLTIIDGAAQRLMRRADKGCLSPEDAAQRVEKIRAAVRRMTRLMESTLTAARMQEGKIKIEINPCDIGKVVREVCERQQEVAENHVISCDLVDLPETIQADTGCLEQVLTNLLSNAVKYAPDAPDIEVKARREGHQVSISVRDHGIGIDQEDLSRVGERFFRAKTSTGIAGTGIGLNLVKTLVEMHGGSIDVQSEKGQGSTFTLQLPVAGPDRKQPKNTRVA